jgi:hypothetical protein
MRRSRTISINGVLTEKRVEHLGDKVMASVGFEIVRFSQPRNTMQTQGIPDRRYYHPTKKLALWWEAKKEGGKQSLAQQDFQSMVQNVGEAYVCGTDDALVAWLRSNGLVR